MFEVLSPVWLEGTVLRFDRIFPHSIITMEERTKDGQIRRWAVEGPDPGRLGRQGIAIESNPVLKAYVEEISHQLTPPCR